MAAVAVFSRREHGRRWTAAKKARIVEESLSPGAKVVEVAQRHAVNANQLYLWRREARLSSESGERFLPVAVSPEGRRSGDGAIEIELDIGVRLRVDASVDEVALGRVLRSLGR